MQEIVISKENSNQRIDKFVRKFLNDAPISLIYKTFRKKDIKVNGKWVKENYILAENDVVRIYLSDDQIKEFNNPKKIENLKVNLDIVYEDENVLIVNKPKGLLVHGDMTEKRMTLSNLVQAYLFKKGEYKNDGKSFIPSPCHRLDRNTSGLVIYAKNLSSSQILMELIKEKDNIKKYYLLLANGMTDEKGEIDAPLKKDEDTGFVKVASLKDGAKSAKTVYKTVSRNKKYSLVEAELVTGRTHQLRVHFAYIGHPIIGDQKYGDFEENKLFDSKFDYHYQFLHAYKIVFKDLPGELSYLSNKEFKAKMSPREEEILAKNGVKPQYF